MPKRPFNWRYIAIPFMFLVALTFFAPSETHAFLERFFGKKSAPQKVEEAKYLIHDETSFTENKKTLHFRPYNNPVLEFDISVPKNWAAEEITKSTSVIKDAELIEDVATFKSELIGTSKVSVTVSIKTLDSEIYAKDWLQNYILTNGYALQDKVQGRGGKYAEAYYTSVNDFTNYNTFISAQINSNYIILCRFDLPLSLKDYLSFVQKAVVQSLVMTNTRSDFIELQKSYTIVDAVKFNYPISWSPDTPDFKNMSRLSIGLQNKAKKKVGSRTVETTEGYINFLTIRRSGNTSFKQELEEQKKYFSEVMGFDLPKMTLSQKPDISSDRFIFSRYEVYEAEYKKATQKNPELRFVALGDENWYIFIFMVSPASGDKFNTWAHNVRCFDIIIKSIK